MMETVQYYLLANTYDAIGVGAERRTGLKLRGTRGPRTADQLSPRTHKALLYSRRVNRANVWYLRDAKHVLLLGLPRWRTLA